MEHRRGLLCGLLPDSSPSSVIVFSLGRMFVPLAIIVILALICFPAQPAWSAGRPTPGGQAPPSTGDATPSPAPTPTPVPVITDCASWSTSSPKDWSLAMCDPFDDNRGGWDTGPYEDSLGKQTRTVADGGYTWNMEATTPFFSSRHVNLEPMGDFYAAVDTYKSVGPDGNTGYGLQFRWVDPQNFYMFLGSDFQTFKIYRFSNGEMNVLQDWTKTDAFIPNDWNRLAVKAVGPEFTFYINDQEVARLTDAAFPQGTLRVVAQLLETGLPATVDFDNFEVRLPGTAVAAVATPVATTLPPPPPPPAPTDTSLPPPPPPPTNTPLPPPELPTATPLPTAAAVPPTPSGGWGGGLPTAESSDVTGWPIVFYDEFEDNGNKWVVGEDFDRLIEASKVIDQTFAWQFKGIQTVHSIVEVPYPPVSDFYVAVSAKRYSGPEDVEYGLTFRRPDPDNFYSFTISDEQKYQAYVQAKDKWYPLIGVTKDKSIRPGESNRIAVKCEGPKITFFINGVQVAEVEDIRFRKGTVALTLSVNQGDIGIIEFDDFELRAPAGS